MKQLILLLALLGASALLFGCVAQPPQATPTPQPTLAASPTATPAAPGAIAEEEIAELNQSLDQEIENLTRQLG
ncbi:MAG: hypothetical protein AB1626_04680 [Candidatus Micrarchaeota archaeon]